MSVLLKTAPIKPVALDRIRDAYGSWRSDEIDGKLVPKYSRDTWQSPLFTYKGIPIIGAVQTPMQAADDTLMPLQDLAGVLAPTEDLAGGGFAGFFGGAANQIGGVAGNIAKTVAEEATETDLFSGLPIDKRRSAFAKRQFENFTPRGSQLTSMYKTLTTDTDGVSEKEKADIEAERISQLLRHLGVSNTPVTKKREKGEAARRRRVMRDIIERSGVKK